MIVAGMHGVSARNLSNGTVGLAGLNAGILLFPSSVEQSAIEAAFAADYSTFIWNNCVGYISCAASYSEGINTTEVKFNAPSADCSGVNFTSRESFLAENDSKSMVAVENVTFYYPSIYKYEDAGYVGGSTSAAYTEAAIESIASNYSYQFSLEQAGAINRLMSTDLATSSFALLQGWYSSGSNRVYKDLVYYKFKQAVTIDTLVTKFSLSGSSPSSSQAAIQLFAKVGGAWLEVYKGNSEFLTRDTLLVRSFNPVEASEWRIGLFGHVYAGYSESSYLNINTFMLGNSNEQQFDTVDVDKAVLIPAANASKYSDPLVEKADPLPVVFLSAGPSDEVGLFSRTLKEGERIPFIESVIRIGV